MSFVKENYESFMKELFLDIYIVMTECKTEKQALQAVERTKALYAGKVDGFLNSIKPLVESMEIPVVLKSFQDDTKTHTYSPASTHFPIEHEKEDTMDCLELLAQKECCCCLDLLGKDVVYGARCSHSFHKTCMQQLLKFNRPCPYCSKALN